MEDVKQSLQQTYKIGLSGCRQSRQPFNFFVFFYFLKRNLVFTSIVLLKIIFWRFFMIGKENLQPKLFETVNIENLVPQNHIFRKIKQVIDFSFINEIASEYYCSDNERPSIPPNVLFKFIFKA